MKKIIYFAGGCFWGIEHKFQKLDGVLYTEVGYANGNRSNITYNEVCYEKTGFVEVVKVKFDTNIISIENIVKYFFKIHNPTTLNRQGFDIGEQYKSAIYFENYEDEEIIKNIQKFIQKDFKAKIVTIIEPLKIYIKGEEYHQNYLLKNNLSCGI